MVSRIPTRDGDPLQVKLEALRTELDTILKASGLEFSFCLAVQYPGADHAVATGVLQGPRHLLTVALDSLAGQVARPKEELDPQDADGSAAAQAAELLGRVKARECAFSEDGQHHVDTSMEAGSHHCFHCGADMRP